MDKVISKEDCSNILRLVAGRVLNFITTILRFFLEVCLYCLLLFFACQHQTLHNIIYASKRSQSVKVYLLLQALPYFSYANSYKWEKLYKSVDFLNVIVLKFDLSYLLFVQIYHSAP